jgi:hypothetical protein
MSTPTDRLSLIQSIYLDALNNEPQDLSAATTPALVAAVQANVANARQTYYEAAAAALTNTAANVETAYTAAQAALDGVRQARTAAGSIATLLGKLNSATAAGTNLLAAAKKV